MAMRIEGAGGRGAKKASTPKKSPSAAIRTNGMTGQQTNNARLAHSSIVSPTRRAGTLLGSSPARGLPTAPGRAPSAPVQQAPNMGSMGVGTTSTGAVAPFAEEVVPPPPPPPSEADFLAQDAEFNDTRATLEREFENLKAQLAKQRGDYDLDINNSLRNLGWQNDPDAEGPLQGGWNQNDKLTGYGNAFQSQLGDFASRGMLDSSLYGGALNDLTRGFEQQRGDINTALQRFITGQETDQTQASEAKTSGITAAQRQALARRAAQYGL